MSRVRISGRARLLPDAVNTDYIISSTRKRQFPDLDDLVDFIFADLPDPLDQPIAAGDVLVAGRDFGCGSAMEVAVDVLLAAGVQAVIARSVARTFHRNAINGGLPLLVGGGDVGEGDRLQIAYRSLPRIRNLTTGAPIVADQVSALAVTLAREGGLLPYCRRYGMPPPGRLHEGSLRGS